LKGRSGIAGISDARLPSSDHWRTSMRIEAWEQFPKILNSLGKCWSLNRSSHKYSCLKIVDIDRCYQLFWVSGEYQLDLTNICYYYCG
jgi:hypothetical protein